MIRVLHVLGGMGQGGAENLLMNLYRNIDRNKIQFDFLVNRKGVFDDEIKEMGGKIFYIPALQVVGQFKYVKNLDNFFSNHNEYKIVHSHLNQVTGLILERAKKAQVPIRIAHSHNSKSSKNILVRIYKKYLGNKIKNNATILAGCSDKANRWLYGKNADKAIIIYNGIEIERFKFNNDIRKSIRNELGFTDNDFIIGHIGRFAYAKNHTFLLKIFKEYKNKNQNSKLLLVGDGKLREKIEKQAKKLNIYDDVKFLGIRSDANKIYQAMDFFVFPSIFEGLPVTLIEAQAAGLKIIASDSITKMVDITGNIKFLSLKQAPHKWAEKIEKEYKKINRENVADKIIQEGYDIKGVARSLENMYINALENI